MNRKSPHTVTYSNLIDLAGEILTDAEGRYVRAKNNGTVYLDPLIHRIECARKLKRMLQRCEPGQQADLFAKFQQIK